MDKTAMIVSIVWLLAAITFYIPGILSSNRGKILRNVALWLGIFVALSLVYKNYGPSSPHPLFSQHELTPPSPKGAATTAGPESAPLPPPGAHDAPPQGPDTSVQ